MDVEEEEEDEEEEELMLRRNTNPKIGKHMSCELSQSDIESCLEAPETQFQKLQLQRPPCRGNVMLVKTVCARPCRVDRKVLDPTRVL